MVLLTITSTLKSSNLQPCVSRLWEKTSRKEVVMTNNQINYRRNVETQRANAASEEQKRNELAETTRANLARETETNRSNVARENETHRANKAQEAENYRSNVARENETHRANTANEALGYANYTVSLRRAAEDARANAAREAETNRSNLAHELETNRSNVAKEAETARHNVQTESAAKTQNVHAAVNDFVKNQETARHNRQTERLTASGQDVQRYVADTNYAGRIDSANIAADTSRFNNLVTLMNDDLRALVGLTNTRKSK